MLEASELRPPTVALSKRFLDENRRHLQSRFDNLARVPQMLQIKMHNKLRESREDRERKEPGLQKKARKMIRRRKGESQKKNRSEEQLDLQRTKKK